MAKYLCRICVNSNCWRGPSGTAFRQEGPTHAANFGYGWEEWNFDFSEHVTKEDNLVKKYGWIEGFSSNEPQRRRRPVPYEYHDAMLYTRHQGTYIVVARITYCEHIESPPDFSHRLPELSRQINTIGGRITHSNGVWTAHPVSDRPTMEPYEFTFRPNIAFDPSDCSFCEPIEINVYDRYGALLAENNATETIWRDVLRQWQRRDDPVSLN
jgi:hypothetical protein